MSFFNFNKMRNAIWQTRIFEEEKKTSRSNNNIRQLHKKGFEKKTKIKYISIIRMSSDAATVSSLAGKHVNVAMMTSGGMKISF
jgi:hypothetical protein